MKHFEIKKNQGCVLIDEIKSTTFDEYVPCLTELVILYDKANGWTV